MDESGGTGLAAAVLGLVAVRPSEPARVLDGLVAAARDLFGLDCGAALLSGGVVHDLVTAAPEQSRTVIAAGFDRGPGDDCARSGRAALCDDLLPYRTRWLAFVARATASGVTAAWALPIRRDDEVFGAMLVLGQPDGRPSLAAAGVLTEAAAVALRDAGSRENTDRELRQLRTGLRSRIVVEQAKGILASYGGLEVEAAFELLRGYSRRHRYSLTDTAAAVVRREIAPAVIVDRH